LIDVDGSAGTVTVLEWEIVNWVVTEIARTALKAMHVQAAAHRAAWAPR
jgi:hypothetical protein